MLGLLLFPVSAFAQKATEQRAYEIRVEWEDLQGYSERVPYKVPIYYDADDNVVMHGPLKINYKHDLSSRVGQKCIIAYNVTGNYVNGKLEGTLSLEKSVTVSVGVIKVKGTINFVNGEPAGTWNFIESITENGKTMSGKLAIVFKDNKLVSFNINDGKECFTIDDNIFSGTHDGKVYKKGVNTSEFIRKTGERTKLDEAAKKLVDGFIAGTISESDLIAQGYGFERRQPWRFYDYDNLRYYISKLMAAHFMADVQYQLYSRAVHDVENNQEIEPTRTLKRVDVISAEEMVQKANYIITAEEGRFYVREDEIYCGGSDYFTCYPDYYIFKTSDGKEYSFTEESKLKFLEAVEKALEERQVYLERLAEQKRAEILERAVSYFNSEFVNNSGTSIVSYKAEGIEETAEGKYTIPSIINVKSDELKGAYRTYKLNVYVSEGYYGIQVDADRTFAQSNLVHIRNDYDAIIDLDRQIAANEKKIEGMSKSLFKSYKAYVATLDMAVKHNDLKATIAARNSLLDMHNDIFAFVEKQKELQKGDAEISSKYASEKEFLKAYSTYMKSRDLSWGPTGAVARIDGFLAVQKGVHEYIGKVAQIREMDAEVSSKSAAYADVLKAYTAYAKTRDLAWTPEWSLEKLDGYLKVQNELLTFIAKLGEINGVDAEIASKCAELKDVLKAYTTYAKTRDLAWTPDWSLEKIDGYIAVQKTCLEFIGLRAVALANDAKIKTLKANAPTMNKAYTVYASACNLAWTPEVDFANVNSLIDVQNRYLAAVGKDNIKEIDKFIKKEKMTDILKILELEELK